MNRRKVIPLLLVSAVLAGTGIYGWQLHARRATVSSHVPAMPNLSALPAALGESVAAAEALARSWRHATAGLAELSRLYHANGFYPEALRCYEGLQALEPGNARWSHLHACILADFGRMDEALLLRERTTVLAPDYIPGWLRLGDVLLKANKPGGAAQAYLAALQCEPYNPFALLGLARIDINHGKWHLAQEHLQEALKADPSFVGAMSLLVMVSEHLGDRATADSLRATIGRREFTDLPDPWLDELSAVCFDAYRLSVAAAIASSAGHHDTARDLLDRAIALAPEAGSYRRQAGHMLLGGPDFAGARVHLEKAVALNAGDSDAWLHLVNALRGLGQEPAALNALLSGLSHCPLSPSLHLEYARWLKSAGRLEEAIAEFRYGYQLRLSDVSPLVELAGVYFSAGRADDAVAALNEALARQPEHPMALATLTFYAISLNDEAGARQRWEQVRRQTKTPPEVVSGLRQAFRQQFGRDLP